MKRLISSIQIIFASGYNWQHSLLSRSSVKNHSLRACRTASQDSSVDASRPYHIPVMLQECCQYLDVQPGKTFVDCTLGGGGHTLGMLERGGKVIGVDQDLDAISQSSKRLGSYLASNQLEIVHSNFRDISQAIRRCKLWEPAGADGVLMDLGVSSYQIDEMSRGFSFGSEGPLDMRMNKMDGRSLTAWHIVNEWSVEDIANVIFQFGEERKSRQIAREIVMARPLSTTLQLAKVIERVTPRDVRMQTLARCFQAIRIAVNDEMSALDEALRSVHSILKPGGRLVVLSYHSLEDRRVKLLFKKPDPFTNKKEWELIEKDIVLPSQEEINVNSRSRSAKLRVARKRLLGQ